MRVWGTTCDRETTVKESTSIVWVWKWYNNNDIVKPIIVHGLLKLWYQYIVHPYIAWVSTTKSSQGKIASSYIHLGLVLSVKQVQKVWTLISKPLANHIGLCSIVTIWACTSTKAVKQPRMHVYKALETILGCAIFNYQNFEGLLLYLVVTCWIVLNHYILTLGEANKVPKNKHVGFYQLLGIWIWNSCAWILRIYRATYKILPGQLCTHIFPRHRKPVGIEPAALPSSPAA